MSLAGAIVTNYEGRLVLATIMSTPSFESFATNVLLPLGPNPDFRKLSEFLNIYGQAGQFETLNHERAHAQQILKRTPWGQILLTEAVRQFEEISKVKYPISPSIFDIVAEQRPTEDQLAAAILVC